MQDFDSFDLGIIDTDDFTIREGKFADLQRRIREAPANLQDALKSVSVQADENQQEVIEANNAVIRMVAPAGSGKTQTVVHRIAHRIRKGDHPDRILVLTFDNAAANSLRESWSRLAEQAKLGEEINVRITTLNAFGYGILREDFPSEYRSLVTRKDQNFIVRHLLKAAREKSPDGYGLLPTNLARRLYLELFSILKNRLFDPRSLAPQELADFLLTASQGEPFLRSVGTPQEAKEVLKVLIYMYRGYEVLLQQRQRIDFDDQKLRAYQTLLANRGVLSRLQNSVSEVIVDEFQDINMLDFELIRTLASSARLLVTGDDDQAIYGFRGCSPEYIINLSNHLQRPIGSYELSTNYRCPRNLVRIADRLISKNQNRIPKQPRPHREDNAAISVISSFSSALEARLIVARIKSLHGQGLAFGDFAILYRTNSQSFPLQVELLLEGVPFSVREQDDLRRSKVLKNLIGLLKTKVKWDQEEEVPAEQAICVVRSYFRYIKAAEERKLQQLLKTKDLREAVLEGSAARVMPKIGRSVLADALEAFQEAQGLDWTLEIVAERFKGLQGLVGSFEDVLDERVPLGEIFELAENFKGSVSEFTAMLEDAIRRSEENAKREDSAAGKVELLTFFRAKGRQWHTVFLAGCSNGLVPHRRGDLEEERRLMYVGMTRASSNLLVSYVQKVCNNKAEPSRFLREAGLLS